ncbi:MAG TPA: glycine--tRNA ligase [Patescibacteria group bacterium]|jgi:glycyl-tRNA synthetase|nr:glycine--tRNA ligase [Patescibacteria group bacterium]
MIEPEKMDKIVSLAKRRGFVYPGSEIYGGLANSWDYGPLGTELKNNIKQLWWKRFVQQRPDMVGIDAALIMNPKVWDASGHLATFTDPLVECKNCHSRFRADSLIASDLLHKNDGATIATIIPADIEKQLEILKEVKCESCGKIDWDKPKNFNLMLKTFLGPSEDQTSVAYFRPETAQAMFIQFKNVQTTSRKQIPFGIAQVGKAFRNEITPGNFVFRTREFEQMEIEYFIPVPKQDSDWNNYFESWKEQMISWMRDDLQLNMDNVHELEVPAEDRAHYSKRTLDFEYDYPFGTKELYGLAYRGDFDLQNHIKASGQDLSYLDPQTNEKYVPHVIEPTWGVDRSFLAVLLDHYKEEGDGDAKRIWLSLPPKLAPYKAAVFPLLKNKPELVEKARGIFDELSKHFMTAWDDRGNVGKRYYSQDEIGTPFGITVDFDTLEDNTVTVRDRDTAQQVRINIDDLVNYIITRIN